MFDNVTKHDLLDAMHNTGRKTKRKTCNSNGTRYTMNRILHGNATSNGKKTDHRHKDRHIKVNEYRLFKDGEWSTVLLSKNARKKMERKGYKVEKVKEIVKVTYFDPYAK